MKNRFPFIVSFFLLFTKIILPQETSGNLEGRIVDSLGIAISSVNISVQSKSLQGIKGTTSDEFGYFRIFKASYRDLSS